jgi:hypothetical protein
MVLVFDQFFGGDMKATAGAVKQSKREMSPTMEFQTIGKEQVIVWSIPTTPEKRKAAGERIIKAMPPAIKPGQKSASELLRDYRDGK